MRLVTGLRRSAPARAGRQSRWRGTHLSEQPGAPVATVISAVAAIVVSVLASIAAVVAAVLPPVTKVAEKSRSIISVPEQRHRQAPFEAAWRSASIAATSAWVGIRPLVTSSPPDRRTAEPKGAAHMFSHTSTAAALPG